MIAFVIVSLITLAGLALLAVLDQNGEVSVVLAKTGTAGVAIGESIAAPTLPSDTYGGLVQTMLEQFTQAAAVVIDLKTRRVFGVSDPTKLDALVGAAGGASSEGITFTPDADQSGTLLTWEGAGNTSVAGLDDAAGVVLEAKPRKSAASLVSAALSALAAKLGTAFDPDQYAVVINQVEGLVYLYKCTTPGALSTAINAVSPGTTDMVCVELTEPPAPASESALVFEKGWQG